MIKNPDLGFSIERHPYAWSQTEDSEPGRRKKGCMGGQGYHDVVTEKRVFGNLFFLSIQFTLFIPSFNVLSCYFNVLLNLVASLTVWIQLISWRSSFRKRKTNSTRLSAICFKQIEFNRRHAFLWQGHARILPVESRMGRILNKSTKNCNSALNWGH